MIFTILSPKLIKKIETIIYTIKTKLRIDNTESNEKRISMIDQLILFIFYHDRWKQEFEHFFKSLHNPRTT